MNISARNQLTGKISKLTSGVVNVEVVIALPGGEEIVSVITRTSAKSLKLKKGSPVVAVIKASDIWWPCLAAIPTASVENEMKLFAINRAAETNAPRLPALINAVRAVFRQTSSAFFGSRGLIGLRWNEIVCYLCRGMGAPALKEPALVRITAAQAAIPPMRRKRWPRD